MVRIFNHWFSLSSIVQILIDSIFALAGGVLGAVMVQSPVPGIASATLPILAIAALIIAINAATGSYDRLYVGSIKQLGARATFSMSFAATLMFVMALTMFNSTSRGGLFAAPTLAFFAGMIAYRRGGLVESAAPILTHRILVLGTGSRALSIPNAIKQSNLLVDIVGFYPSSAEEQQAIPQETLLSPAKGLLQTAIDLKAHEIVVAIGDRRGGALPMGDLLDCKLRGIRVSDLSSHFEMLHGQIRIDSLKAGWLIFGQGFEQGIFRKVCKRIFDIVFSVSLLVLTLPIMLITMALIVLESGFPIFYCQERSGQEGRSFKVIKFRSMRTDAEKDGKPKWASGQDDRVTRVGRFIRKFRIDELPQLINVLCGEMSLVGPRPERPFFVEQLTKELPFYALRHSVKPGLTGWAQVSYGYGASVEDACEKLQYDLYYVKNNSLLLDFLVLFKTVGVVLNGQGAR